MERERGNVSVVVLGVRWQEGRSLIKRTLGGVRYEHGRLADCKGTARVSFHMATRDLQGEREPPPLTADSYLRRPRPPHT